MGRKRNCGKGKDPCGKKYEDNGKEWPIFSFLCLYSLSALLCIVFIFADLLVLVDLETGHDLDHCFYSSGECSYLNHYSILGFQRVIQLRTTFFVLFF